MKPWIALCLLPLLSFAQDEEPAATRSALDDLAWLAGHWSAEEGGVIMEELWTAPSGGVLLGLHRDVRLEGDQLLGFEYLRIEADDEGVRYLASPGGKAATAFELVQVEGQEAIFENLEHDFPQRIIYRRDGEALTARVEDAAGKKGLQWRWELRE